jgi:hypothetical protein
MVDLLLCGNPDSDRTCPADDHLVESGSLRLRDLFGIVDTN